MKTFITGCLLTIGLTAWLVGSAQLPPLENKTLEELMDSYDPVSVTRDQDRVYITFVKGADVYRCTVTPYVDPNNPSASRPGYNIYCEPMRSHLPL